MAVRREIKEVEAQFNQADEEYEALSKKLRHVTQERLNAEEELLGSNVRLKQLLGELQAAREAAQAQSSATVQDSKMTMGELTRKVESTLMTVLDERFRDEAFTSAITEQSVLSTDKVTVEFEGDEVKWSLQDNYSFEMLLADASRYWDVAPQDAILVDERGAIWPNDAYVGLELQRAANALIKLRIKPVAITVEEELEMYGREGGDDSDDSEEDFDMSLLAIATAAEDELLLAQAKGTTTSLTTKQKLALRRKLKYELYYFLAFVVVFVWSMYARRTVKEAYRLQEAISTAFTEENFGDYNEKTFLDIATPQEMFDWMQGPLQDGLFPDTLYNDQPIPDDRLGYVMTYNRIVGNIRMRQLRVAPDKACKLSPAVRQSGVTEAGRVRRRQFVDYCFAAYGKAAASNESYGLNAALQEKFVGGFAYSSAEENKLLTTTYGQVASYDGSGFVRDLDPQSRPKYLEAVNELRDNLWVDAQTRAVLVSLNLYNGNYNYYCVSQFLIEFTPGGTVVPTATNKIVSLDLYETEDLMRVNNILVRYTPEVLTYIGALAYLFAFLYKMYRIRKVTKSIRPLFRDSWNLVDMLLLMSLAATSWLRFNFYVSSDRRNFDPFDSSSYHEMSRLADQYQYIFTFDAATVLILVFKSLKYFALQKDLMLLQKTLAQAVQDLSTFLAILIFLFLGFIIMGYNIFGMQATGFKTLQDTLGTLFLILLGEFDYEEMRAVHDFWALVFFLFFIIFMFFIVLNIFLAILNDAYTVVHTDVVWDELEKRKPLSLREKFEVRKAIWRERKNISHMKKLKKEKVKQAKKMKKDYEKKAKDRFFLDRISLKNKRAAEHAGDEGATSGTRDGDGAGVRRTAAAKAKPFT